MKLNKEQRTKWILEVAKPYIEKCAKIALQNIVLPRWSDIGLWGQIFLPCVDTKEGQRVYPKSCRVVVRVIDGKVFMTGGKPDAYAWSEETSAKYLSDPEKVRYIGANSPSGLINLAEILQTITDPEEKMIFADWFCMVNRDFLLVGTPEEQRQCVEVTQELYDAGLKTCVDDWVEPDDNGEAEATPLNVGDFLIVKETGVYCIRRAEFMETYKLYR